MLSMAVAPVIQDSDDEGGSPSPQRPTNTGLPPSQDVDGFDINFDDFLSQSQGYDLQPSGEQIKSSTGIVLFKSEFLYDD